MSDYKPGTVAMVTHVSSGEPPVLAFRDGDKGAVGWALADHRASSIWLSEDVVSDVRPLVVLDPEDEATIDRVADAIRDAHGAGNRGVWAGIDWLRTREAVRSLLAPPKPAEPTGKWAVVEGDGVCWIRAAWATGRPWNRLGTDVFEDYASIDATEVLSEGVRP